ncbi:MAG: hypothetical protein DMG10_14215 [Acidobacteria bacterium]|nr:MAG: hypothetical protein DMG10_14215 [Acidobacteriota bacterium]
MKPDLWDYIKTAFNARPMGMFIPPNWVGLGVLAFLGTLNPGFWIMGAGLELGYLLLLSTNPRFQRVVAGLRISQEQHQRQARLDSLVNQLGKGDQARYRNLVARCRTILEQQVQTASAPPALEPQAEGLGHLSWIFLKLLVTRQAIEKILRESAGTSIDVEPLEDRLESLQRRIAEPSLSEELRRSLTGQIEILRQRLAKRGEAREKLAFLDAELARIQEQVELLREQSVLSTDPEVVSQRIDEITTTLGGTTDWIREQQKVYGAMEDLLAEPPPISVPGAVKESQ